MYDSEIGTEISFEQINGKDYTIVKIAGVLDLESAAKIGHLVNDSIPIEYDGNVIFDIRKVDDRLRNEDADEIAKLVFRSRYFLRKPVAVLALAESPGRAPGGIFRAPRSRAGSSSGISRPSKRRSLGWIIPTDDRLVR